MSAPTSPVAPATSPFTPATLFPQLASNTNGLTDNHPAPSTPCPTSDFKVLDADVEPLELTPHTSDSSLGKRKRDSAQQLLSPKQQSKIRVADKCIASSASSTPPAATRPSCCPHRTCWHQFLGKPISYWETDKRVPGWPKDWDIYYSFRSMIAMELLAAWPQFKSGKPDRFPDFPSFNTRARTIIQLWLCMFTPPSKDKHPDSTKYMYYLIREVGVKNFLEAKFAVEDTWNIYRDFSTITGPEDLDSALLPIRERMRDERIAAMTAKAEAEKQLAARRKAARLEWEEKNAENDSRAWFQYWVEGHGREADLAGIVRATSAYFEMTETAAKHGWPRAIKEYWRSEAAPPLELRELFNVPVEEQPALTAVEQPLLTAREQCGLTVEDVFKVRAIAGAAAAGSATREKRERKPSKRALESEGSEASGSPRKRAKK